VPLDGSLSAFTDGVWLSTAPVRIVGMPLDTMMTVLRLGDGSLLVHSPVALTPDLRAAVEAVGPVAHLYAPNTYHHLFIAEWCAAFPSARVHAPAGLAKKRPDLRIDRVVDGATAGEPAFAGVLEEVRIEGFRLEETVLLHRPARTLVVADLVHNVGRPSHRWARIYTKAMGFYDRVAVSRVIRAAAFSDRAAARRSLDRVLAGSFDRMIVGHGTPLRDGAREALDGAYAWLPRSRGTAA
jgi:hypothetical protein